MNRSSPSTSGIERDLRALGESEVKSTLIGETVMKALEKIDQIAYVRFASVYRQFADVNSFMQEIQGMLSKMDDKKIITETEEEL